MSKCSNLRLGQLLHAYELNALSEEDADRFEIHLLECQHCFAELEAFEDTAALLRSDEEIKNLARQASTIPESPADSFWRRLWRSLWPDAPLVFKPIFAFIVILLLIVPAYLGLRGSRDRDINPPQLVTLLPEKSPAEELFHADMDNDGVLRFEFTDAVVNRSYLVSIESENGETIYRNHDFDTFDEYGWGELIIPHAIIKPGYYKLTIMGPRAGSGQDTTSYYFMVVP
jgi:hypothetical protein